MSGARSFLASTRRGEVVYLHGSAVVALLLVLVHQGVVASSTFFLTEMIEAFRSGGDFTRYLFLYFLAMALPYVPGCLSYVFLQKWINDAHREFVALLVERMDGRTEISSDTGLKDRVDSVLSRNSFPVLKDYITFVHDFASFLLNSVLSVLVIGMLLPSQLVLGYAVSVLACFIVIVCTKKTVASASTAFENRFIAYANVLAKAWGNLTLGNVHNKALWCESRRDKGEDFYAASDRLQCIRQAGNFVLAVASLGPTIYLVGAVLTSDAAMPSVVAAVIVNLTRIMLILNSLSTLVHAIFDGASMRARLDVLFDAEASMTRGRELSPRAAGTLFLNGQPVHGALEIAAIVANASCGRFTLTGGNGSGKSTALLVLKRMLGEKSFLLPAHSGDLAWHAKSAALSTGQRATANLREIFALERIDVLLLDEWDANLDAANSELISGLIDALGQRKTILEVRHIEPENAYLPRKIAKNLAMGSIR